MKYKKILIAVDGSKCSMNAAKKGVDLASQLSASVILLYVIDIAGLLGYSAISATIDPDLLKTFHDEAEKVVKEIATKNPSDMVSTLTIEGDPQQQIVNVAKDKKADIIIMGTHGRTGLKHMIMGSVAEDVIKHSEIPVLIIPETKKVK
jgi:nucleotide-binding universal stress UspA family protein